MTYHIELTARELGEVAAKLANEIETYGGPYWFDAKAQATPDLCSGFMKVIAACETSPDPIYVTTLMAKWAGYLRAHPQPKRPGRRD